MAFKGTITLVLDIEQDEDGDLYVDDTVTVTGITKDELYYLFEGADLGEDLGNYVYEHMARMES